MKTILVIENDRPVRETLVDLLTLEGYNVLAAAHGAAGLDIVRVQLPDLVLTDVVMPYLDGYDLFRTLRSSATTSRIPVIFLTALIDKSDVEKGVELGVDAYITKPFTGRDLLRVIDEVLLRSRNG